MFLYRGACFDHMTHVLMFITLEIGFWGIIVSIVSQKMSKNEEFRKNENDKCQNWQMSKFEISIIFHFRQRSLQIFLFSYSSPIASQPLKMYHVIVRNSLCDNLHKQPQGCAMAAQRTTCVAVKCNKIYIKKSIYRSPFFVPSLVRPPDHLFPCLLGPPIRNTTGGGKECENCLAQPRLWYVCIRIAKIKGKQSHGKKCVPQVRMFGGFGAT